jgi:glycosyltransferase involved in cell wall biosynthesis
VAAAAGALPEAAGDAALLVDPLDVEALADALGRILRDESLRAGLVERGRARVERYTWSECSREFVALYRELAAVT